MPIDQAELAAVIDIAQGRDTETFITTAQVIVDEELAGKGYSQDRLDQITLYLAAHFACITEERGGLVRSKQGEAEDAFRAPNPNTAGFASTRYGQQAMILDTSGTLAQLSTNAAKLKARMTVMEVTNYPHGVATSDAGTIDPFNE